jgi:ribonuclease HII
MASRSRISFKSLVIFDREIAGSEAAVLAGVDEAGRGALAGPVVAAAVVCRPDECLSDVRDSKLISENQREKLYDMIISRADSCSTGIVDHIEIDRTNILQATLQAMRLAIDSLNVEPSLVLVDGRQIPRSGRKCVPVTGGDRASFSIAAASIVAKVTRDRIMRELDGEFPQYGFSRNKGYGTRKHLDAIERFGQCPIHRRSFRVSVD